jgi:Phage T7 capsid assembly protein
MAGEQAPNLTPHDAAMVAKVDSSDAAIKATVQGTHEAPVTPPVDGAKPARPEHVPEKFWNAEKGTVDTDALLKSYTELEKGKAPADEKPPEGETDPAAEAVKAAQLDMGTLSEEFAQAGKLSDASYAALEKAGIPKATVDQYIAGQQALAGARDAEGFALAGGQEQYGKMVQWALANLSEAEQSAFDTAVVGSPASMNQAITALKSKYEAANGSDPKLLGGQQGGGGSEGDTPFASRAEVTVAMRDPRYSRDPAYRAVVERRVGLMDNF